MVWERRGGWVHKGKANMGLSVMMGKQHRMKCNDKNNVKVCMQV